MIWGILKKINIKELWGLTILCAKHPRFVIPTLRGTKRCVDICNSLFGKSHHGHNIANAFRHALWNLLIAHYCYKNNKDEVRVLGWTKIITDWHEDFSLNEPLERAMDLHNNACGRKWFSLVLDKNEEEIVNFLQKKRKNALKVTKIEEIKPTVDALIYLES